ncbi:MAG: hypothetical protein ACXADB_08300 [Candidatus Hermodarchaeia archaeon]|jgi:hypothetical protein
MNETPKAPMSDKEFLKEATHIVDQAEENGLVIRILGALAIRMQTPHKLELHRNLDRLGEGAMSFTDIDIIGPKSQRRDIEKFFEKTLGFHVDRYALLAAKDRYIYHHSQKPYYVDVFLDCLDFSHKIEFARKKDHHRLVLDKPTITLADLVLEKTQIHAINEKDIKDLITLFAGHEVGIMDKDPKTINEVYIGEILCDDWGFWYDATGNLRKVIDFVKKYCDEGLIGRDECNLVVARVEELLLTIDNTSKTKNWEKRAKKGTKKQWWKDVEESDRGADQHTIQKDGWF